MTSSKKHVSSSCTPRYKVFAFSSYPYMSLSATELCFSQLHQKSQQITYAWFCDQRLSVIWRCYVISRNLLRSLYERKAWSSSRSWDHNPVSPMIQDNEIFEVLEATSWVPIKIHDLTSIHKLKFLVWARAWCSLLIVSAYANPLSSDCVTGF